MNLILKYKEIFILPEFRSCGLGGQFLKFLKEDVPAVRLRLELCPSNTKACEIYKRNGFQILNYNQMIYDKQEP